ncbi:MAG: hypothetical protein ACFB5Z_00530 [Elainellaceae cyanobacterium]
MSVSFATACVSTLITSLVTLSAFSYSAQTYSTLDRTDALNQQNSSQLQAHRGSGRLTPAVEPASAQAYDA